MRRRKSTRRRLKPETLETRQLLAANIFHNELMPEDVNEDGVVSALDALTIINEVNRQARGDAGASGEPEGRGRGRMTDVNNDGHDTALDALLVINRLNRDETRSPGNGTRPDDNPVEPPTDAPTSDPAIEVRSIDGSNNNLDYPTFGAANTELRRTADADYADGISEPGGEDRPSAREISNALSAANPAGTTNERNLSSFVFAWGQFLDHDIDLSLESSDEADSVAFDIEVPQGDPLFDPFGTGEETIHLTRSMIADGTGGSIENPAQQVNAITAWVDGSQVYGSDQETSDALREFVGGRLLISGNGLLPTDENDGLLAGDIRAAENVMLTSMHALFVREHNRLADEISAADSSMTDEEVYQQAREIVIAELQSITYNEYLPALLGENALSDYAGYDSTVDPAIANEFSTAAFRFGHTTLNDEFRVVGNDGVDVQDSIRLADAFFQPELLEDTGIDGFLKYASSTLSQEIDLEVVDSLRNFLFGPPGAGGLDLVSLNIQRGRDHGLADYNSTRQAYGLDPVESFSDITNNADVAEKLESLYGDVDNIDLWVGLLAEDHTESGSLGQTATAIIADQFERLRDGDRFYYINTMSAREIRQIENMKLSDIIERNTNIDSLQENVFFFTPKITGTVVAQTSVDKTPVSTPTEGEPIEDLQVIGNNQLVGRDGPVIDQSGSPDQGNTGRMDQGKTETGQQDQGQQNPNDRDRSDRQHDVVSAAGILVELVNSDGSVVDSTLTDDKGNYTFDHIGQSGAYQVRIAASDEWTADGYDTWNVLISNGDEGMDGIDFRVLV